ncbi:MAG: hypothetical protein KF781_01805 [Chitinophagaceae bacterium]|nr:hypothetical protein [Chitinophagaceae bacterium]MCW5904242.1 hypothetical protein [Chitinophagaceae bacterium]
MGYIKEPKGIDFVVDPTPLSIADKKRISEVIAFYKATGRKMPKKTSTRKKEVTNTSKKKVLA